MRPYLPEITVMTVRRLGLWACLGAASSGCGDDTQADGDSTTGAVEGAGVTSETSEGDDVDPGTGPQDPSEPQEPAPVFLPGDSPIRRMTRRDYDNTVHDLLNDETRPARLFPAEEESLGFNNNAVALGVTELLAGHYLDAAELLAAAAAKDLPSLLGGCDPETEGEKVCARQFIEHSGAFIYRRPLAVDEVDILVAVFKDAREQFDFETGIRLTLTTMLQSPHFLYRVELGAPIPGATGVVKVAPYELASRLSYLLWGTMPDTELFAAAATGRLENRGDVEKQARRMLADPRAREVVRDFHAQWLKLGHIEEVEKDPDVFPDFDPKLRPLLRAEADAFLDSVIWDGQGDLDTLLLAPYTFLNGELADYYGLEGPSGEAFEKVELPEGRGSGILTQGGLMAVLAKANQTTPVLRGKFIREHLLCQIIPPPPDNIDITPPDVDPNLPTRERFAMHSADPTCAGCHSLMDPLGFGFEHFDGIGKWRDIEAGQPIDATGNLGKDTFDGVPELAALIVDSAEVEGCMTLQWFRYAYGRAEGEEDVGTLAALTAGFAGSGRRIQDLIVALTQTDAFLYRHATPDAGDSP